MIALAVGAALATGVSVMALLRVRTRTGAGLIGFAFFLGVLSLALWTHALLFVRIPVTLWSVLAAPVLLGAAAAGKGDRSVLDVEWRSVSLGAVPVIASALFAVAGAFSGPHLGSDGEVFYALKAQSIVHYGTFWNPDFMDPARIHPASRRPLLLPCLYADFFLLSGTDDHRLLRLWFALLHVGSLGVLYERARPPLPWLAVFAWMPALWRESQGVFTGFPDPLLGILFLLAVDAARTGEGGLATLSLTAAVLLKQDAWTFPIAIALATAAAVPSRLRAVLRLLAIPAAAAAIWWALSRHVIPSFDFQPGQFAPDNFLSSLRRWPLVLERLGSELVKPKHWGVFWIASLFGLILSARRLKREETQGLIVILFQAAVYLAVWATYPSNEIAGWMRVQDMRLLLHLAPLAWMEWVRGETP